ncbi:hypothetical protein IHC87_17420 [Photobacterium damselae subsp. damselae]|uniref:hypothetical protein n=1 Tax=Photobacterium damselae TaxID=38293 RepID=UPI001F375C8F|nr:hypothetical protein [Photobacterium damselae]UJZ96348.1 hypothetical protein IHC87_17420 [Photobacterium damselae subsp. damselae]UJZ99747.1 hypothetical protein IHC88_20070 [Photobacterium damselae subsp. damselae]
MSDLLTITGNETIEELDAMLESLDDANIEQGEVFDTKEENVELSAEDKEGVVPIEEVDNSTESAPVVDGEQSQLPPETSPVILAKDNVHTIPFEVLEDERRENERLKQALLSTEEKLTQAEHDKRLLDVRNEQLIELGVEPADLPENFKLTKEMIDNLKDDYPEIATIITGLNAQVEHLADKAQQPQQPTIEPNQGEDEVLVALKGNQELSGWQVNDPIKWALALDIDDALRLDPQWQQKSCAERFDEVVRLTNQQSAASALTDTAAATNKAQEAKQKAETELPNSPSELSTSDNSSDGSLIERAAKMSQGELAGMMSTMSAQQVEALLEQFDDY